SQWNALREIIDHPHITAAEENKTNSIPLLYLNQKTADLLLQSIHTSMPKSQRTIDSTRSPISQRLPVSVRARISVEHQPVEGQNVIGFLPGRDSVLANEHILISAHYDHLGIRADSIIYYGADDNASGTAAVLSLAKAFTANTIWPKRSLIFALFDGEEHGLYGSKHFSEFPPVPLEDITANLNLDMIGRNVPDSIYVIGSNMHSQDLYNISRIADAYVPFLSMNYRYNSVTHPTRLYYRSDYYSFAKYEIPIIGYFDGFHPDYHEPTDVPEKLQYRKIQRVTNLAYLTAWGAANYPDTLSLNGTLMK
ncbi:MAG TPA: M28 family peptidase, partial [bacterium]|nr:M28 family peptidase [bacterium]